MIPYPYVVNDSLFCDSPPAVVSLLSLTTSKKAAVGDYRCYVRSARSGEALRCAVWPGGAWYRDRLGQAGFVGAGPGAAGPGAAGLGKDVFTHKGE